MRPSPRLVGQTAILLATVAVGAFLRFEALGEPSYWLDEILHQQLTDAAVAKPWWQWFARLHDEHAGLYYLTQFATRLFGRSELAGRSAAALFGVVTILLLWLVPLDWRTRAAAVMLLAVSPLHVYYSREARGYALLLLLTAALIVILMRGRSLFAAGAVILAMAYSSAVAATVIASACAVSLLLAVLDRERRRWFASVSGFAILALALLPLIYAKSPAADPNWPGFPRLDWPFLTSLARMFSVTALGSQLGGRAALAMFILAIIGAVALVKRDRNHGVVVIGMTVLPLGIALAALRFYDHFFAVRYVMAAVIGFLLLAAAGVAWVAGLVPGRASTVLTVAMAVVLAGQGWRAARREPFQKLDWRAIAAVLETHVKPGDVIATAEPYSYVSLRHYLRVPPGVHFVLLDFVGAGEYWLAKTQAAWLVTAGYSTPVSRWICRYPALLASPLEGFRLHYAPSTAHFLAARSTRAERRAVSMALGSGSLTLELGPEDDVFLGEGWAGPDVSRWATGLRSTIAFPRGPATDRVIRFHAYPLTHPGLPEQTMRVILNGEAIATLTLAPEWRDYEIPAAAKLWREGMNGLVFEFARATAPSAVDPSSSDSRELSTAFERISIEDAGRGPARESSASRVITIRAGAGRFLEAGTVWRNTRTRFPAARLRREVVEPLLGRLGYDPEAAWPQLASGRVRLDNVVESIAYGGDCEDHASFLRRAFGILLRRAPSIEEEKDLLARLAANPSRVVIVGRIAKSEEFRGQVLAP